MHGCPPQLYAHFFLCGQVSCSTEPFGDRGKDRVSGSGRTFPVIQPGGVFMLLPIDTGTNRRGWSRAAVTSGEPLRNTEDFGMTGR